MSAEHACPRPHPYSHHHCKLLPGLPSTRAPTPAVPVWALDVPGWPLCLPRRHCSSLCPLSHMPSSVLCHPRRDGVHPTSGSPRDSPSRTELSNSHLWTQWPATARCPLPVFLVTAAPACSLHGVGACWAGIQAHILQCRRHCVLLIPFLLSTCQGQTLLGPGQVLCVGHRQQSSNFKGRRVPSARKERKGVLLWADFVPVDITQPEAAGIVTDFPSSF